jgi:hypothetical protein
MSLRSAPGSSELIVVAAVVYVVAAGWAMTATTYDIWGALVVAPILGLVSVPVVHRLLRGLDPRLSAIAFAGLTVHAIGSVARYWVAFDAYGGSADASAYHDIGAALAAEVRGDPLQIASVIPTPTGTVFIEKLTGLLYVVTGPSRMAGFLVFGWFAFVGCLLFVRAGCVGIRELDQRRYTAIVVFLPSLVYWPSSIGKESWMLLTLGVASYGLARLWSGHGWILSSLISAIGIGGAACVRPHVAAMWAVGALFASVSVPLGRRASRSNTRRLSPATVLATVVLALCAALVVGRSAITYLDTGEDSSAPVTARIESILDSTERRTTLGGSGFTPPDVSSPAQWPYAIARTLSRPFIIEANSISSLLPALEMTALLLLAALSLNRLASLPLVLLRRPYLNFAIVTSAVFGLAFANIGNLAILTRQRSLILPLLVVPLCLHRLDVLRRASAPSTPPIGRAAVRPLTGVHT